jgi:rRNA maturation protein Nop10
MDSSRKVRCDCGHYLEPTMQDFEGIYTEANVCPKCGYTTFSAAQAKKFIALKEIHRTINSQRKIIKIGSSIGITLPNAMKKYGAKVGKKVQIEALNEKEFKVTLI